MAVESIKQISIKGFKSLRDVSLELGPLTVMIGANGSGKSNFIEFFRMLKEAFWISQGGLQLYVGKKGGADSLLYYGPKITRNLDASIEFAGEERSCRYSFSLTWGVPNNLVFASEEFEYKSDADPEPQSLHLGSGHGEPKLLEVADLLSESPQKYASRVVRDNLRLLQAYHFHDTSDEAGIRRSYDRNGEFHLMHQGENLAAFLHWLQERRPQHYRRILSTVRLIAPFIQDFRVAPEPDRPLPMLRWVDRSGAVLGPHQLSDGTLRAIALVTALMQPETTMPNVMLVDEPELGLHPQAISLVSGLLRAASLKRQVIVATQSPRLLTDLCPEDIVVVERREGNGQLGESTFNRLSSEELGGWLDDYDLGTLYEMNVTGGGP